MQIVAESQAVESAPYVHLGYLSASSMTKAPAVETGLMLALAGAILAARFKRVDTSLSVQTRFGFRRSLVGYVGVGAIIVGILTSLVSIFDRGPTFRSDPYEKTHTAAAP